MKNILKVLVICSFMALLSVSCSKDDSPKTQQPAPAPKMERGLLLGILDSAAYSCSGFADAVNASPIFSFFSEQMGNNNVVASLLAPAVKTLVVGRQPLMDVMFARRLGSGLTSGRQWQIESYAFTYSSVDANGDPITLCGRVTFPNNTVAGVTHEVSSLSLFSHQYIIFQDWAPSNSLSLMSVRCLYNSAVIEPDFQGYGYDNMKHVHTIFSTETMGRQLADCAMAAVELMKQHGVKLATDGIVTNWGTSAGTPYALSFARYYDREASHKERAALPLKSTMVNNGVLDFAALTVYQDQHPELDISYHDYMTAMNSMPNSVLHGYTAAQFFPEWMNSTIVDYNGQKASYLYWSSRFVSSYTLAPYAPDPSKVLPNMGMRLSSDMLKADGHVNYESAKTQTFLQICREQMTFEDWIPQTEIYIANEDEDLVSPYDLAHDFYEKLRERSSHIHWLVIDNSMSPLRAYLSVHYVSSYESLMYMTLAPEPKDMRLFHREEL